MTTYIGTMQSPVAELVSVVSLPAAGEFTVARHFIERVDANAKVRIGALGGAFRQRMLPKVEPAISRGDVAVQELLLQADERLILAEIGPLNECPMQRLWQLISAQGRGEQGPLCTNGHANVCHVLDATNERCAIGAFWFDNAWSIHCFPKDRPLRWFPGCRLLIPT